MHVQCMIAQEVVYVDTVTIERSERHQLIDMPDTTVQADAWGGRASE